jgi:predicted membrane-bound spermidine synthase
MTDATAAAPIRQFHPARWALPVIFFLSGFPALIYQLTWQRMLFSVYGINVEAVTVIVSGFLLGLGLGSFVGGRVSAMRGVNLLAVFAAIELAIAAIGYVSLDVLRRFGMVAAGWPGALTTAAMLALLVVPTLLMGATLPILVAYLVRRIANVGRSVGLLYFVNTLGSAAACFASGIFLMRLLGMHGSVRVAVGFNVAVGMIALLAAVSELRRNGEEPAGENPAMARDDFAPSRRRAAALLAALAGYLALSYEILWFRAFAVATGTASAFALVLGAYLCGIAIGSLAGRRFCHAEATQSGVIRVLTLTLVAYAAIGLVLLPLSGWAASIGAFVPAMLLLVALHTLVGGMAFPLIAHLGVPPDRAAGRGVSIIYLANILGSVLGSLATGFVVMDHLGLAEVTGLLTVLVLGLALALLFRSMADRRRAWAAATAIAVAALAVPLTIPTLFGDLYERLVYKHEAAKNHAFATTVENKSGVINVTPDLVVYGGGFYDGRVQVSLVDDRNLLVRPALLSYFHPAPKKVLMIGLATGAWVQLLAANPAVEHITVIEINRGYLELIARHGTVRSILANPKVEIIVDDGRRWLNRNPGRRFDAIVQNTTWHYRAHATNLLSSEYLALVMRHLLPGGVTMYNTTYSARAMRTACALHPGAVRFMNMMVVGVGPVAGDPQRLDRALREMRVDGVPLLPDEPVANARRAEILAAARMPAREHQNGAEPMESCDSILARTAALTIITDDNMGEEWRSALPDDLALNKAVRIVNSLIGRGG